MALSLPGEVRAALIFAGLSDDEAQLKTGDELREAIGDQLTYELVVALAGQRLAVAHRPGQRGRIPQEDLIERNLDILRLRIVDGLNFAAIGREVGLTGSRVSELLRNYYGVGVRPMPMARVLHVPAASVPVLRDALLGLLQGRAEVLVTALDTGVEGWYASWHKASEVVNLLLDIQKDKDTAINIGNIRRRQLVTDALTGHVCDETTALLAEMS